MILYTLACDQGHTFDSWFANSAAYDKQVKRSLVTCPVCNSAKVEKALMAPRLSGTKKGAPAPVPAGPGWPPYARGKSVLECVHVVLDEEWAHHGFCARDLDLLRS